MRKLSRSTICRAAVTDEQSPGKYRLKQRDDDALFGYVVGPHSWKQYLFPPRATLAEANQTDAGWQFQTVEDDPPKYAFLGVRACELAAMRVQDRVFLSGTVRRSDLSDEGEPTR